MKRLECSTKGDKRFSALCARIEVNGKFDTIENHYQLSKLFLDVNSGKIIKFDDFKKVKRAQYLNDYKLIGFEIGNKSFELYDLSYWYKSLWYKYFIKNKHLLKVIAEYDEFTDIFKKENTINSQADIIKQIKENGLASLKEELSDFFKKIS